MILRAKFYVFYEKKENFHDKMQHFYDKEQNVLCLRQ